MIMISYYSSFLFFVSNNYSTPSKIQQLIKLIRDLESRGDGFVVLNGEVIETSSKCLILQNKEISKIQEVKGVEALAELKELNLSWNKIEELPTTEEFKNLEKLILEGNKINIDDWFFIHHRAVGPILFFVSLFDGFMLGNLLQNI